MKIKVITQIQKQIDDFIHEVREFKNEVTILKDEVVTLKDEIEQLKEKNVTKKVLWAPKMGETYYYIKAGDVYGYPYTNCIADFELINDLNCYETKEIAEREAFEQLFRRKLRNFSYENNEEIIDWTNPQQLKFFVIYDYNKEEIVTDSIRICRDFGQIYFTSEKIAEKAIKEFEHDFVKYFSKSLY